MTITTFLFLLVIAAIAAGAWVLLLILPALLPKLLGG